SGIQTIDIYHVYTGAKVGTLDGGAGAQLGEMAISSDGSTLFAIDGQDGSVAKFDLSTQTKSGSLPISIPFAATGCHALAYTRTNGRGLLLVNDKRAIDLTTSNSVAFSDPSPSMPLIVMTPAGNGDSLYAVDLLTGNTGPLMRFSLSFSWLN